MTSNLTTFTFPLEDKTSGYWPKVRVVADDKGEPWFVAKDVCDVLDISNVSSALSYLDADERNTLRIAEGNRGNPNYAVINESGVYSLAFNSRKPEAKRFKKWVTSEVLPAIRKTGGYIPANAEDSDEAIMARALLIADKTIKHLEVDNAAMHQKLDYSTVDAYRALHKGEYWTHGMKVQLGMRASKLCRERGIEIKKEMRKNHIIRNGKPCVNEVALNVYPTTILDEVAKEVNA